MELLTIKEIANQLGINQIAAKGRMQRSGIKPIRLIGMTGIYDPSVIEQIRNVKPVGRPKTKRGEGE